MRRVAGAVAGVASLLVLVAGCTTGTDDELQARPTPTVTVTGEPLRELPEQLDLSSDVDLSGAVVWVDGSVVHVDDQPVDVTPLRPSRVLVLDSGVLALADEQVWFLAGRRAVGLPLPPTTSMDLSADGSQLVLRVADRDEPVAWTRSGVRVAADAVAPVRSEQRTVAGPGDFSVVRRDAPGTTGTAGTTVVDADDEPVAVPRLPQTLRVAGWTDPDELYGSTAGGDVVSCRLTGSRAGGRGCTTLGSVDPVRARALVFGEHPAG